MKCPVCDSPSTESRPLFRVRDYAIVACRICTHAYVENMPSDAELAELYKETADSFLGSGGAGPMAAYLGDNDRRFFAFYADRLDAIARTGVGKAGKILDFGCSQGAFVATLRKKGFTNVIGFDRSASAVEQGRKRWQLDLHSGSLEDFIAAHAASFDVVNLGNVLEHVPNPKALLADLRRLVRPSGGTLALCVPNTRSLQVRVAGTRSPVIDPPHHLQYYGPQSLARLVSSCGFSVTRMKTEFWQPASDLYLHMKGVPLWLGRTVRYGMGIPAYGINALKLGGVIAVLAR
jgi:SAM-dependent methyltransferase